MLVENVHTGNTKHSCIDINMQNPLLRSVFVVQRQTQIVFRVLFGVCMTLKYYLMVFRNSFFMYKMRLSGLLI